MKIREILHRLRNPYGKTEADMRNALLQAATLIESVSSSLDLDHDPYPNDKGGCEYCTDPSGESGFPHYGLAPHEHKWEGNRIVHTKTLPRKLWPDNFQEDQDAPGMGTWWCQFCGHGKPEGGEA